MWVGPLFLELGRNEPNVQKVKRMSQASAPRLSAAFAVFRGGLSGHVLEHSGKMLGIVEA